MAKRIKIDEAAQPQKRKKKKLKTTAQRLKLSEVAQPDNTPETDFEDTDENAHVKVLQDFELANFGRVLVMQGVRSNGVTVRTADSAYSILRSHEVTHLAFFFRKLGATRFEACLHNYGNPKDTPPFARLVRSGSGEHWRIKYETKTPGKWRWLNLHEPIDTRRAHVEIALLILRKIKEGTIRPQTRWFKITGPSFSYLLSGMQTWRKFAQLV